jgi:hypothetical protein
VVNDDFGILFSKGVVYPSTFEYKSNGPVFGPDIVIVILADTVGNGIYISHLFLFIIEYSFFLLVSKSNIFCVFKHML